MKAFKRITSFISALAVAVTVCVSIDISVTNPKNKVYAAENTKTSGGSWNQGMTAVPAPGEVKIDGDLSDWDWSGRIKMFEFYYEIDTKSVETAMMYDDKYLYVASKFKDQTPLDNYINPITEPNWTWRGDGHQFRVLTDGFPIWMDVAYNSDLDIGAIQYTYFPSMTSANNSTLIQYRTLPGSTVMDQTALQRGNPKRIDKTGEMKWVKDADGNGYVLEMKIPWTILYDDVTKGGVPGSTLRIGIENKWTNNINPGGNSFSFVDNVQPGKTGFGIASYNAWGDVYLSPTGNVPTRNYVVDLDVETLGSIHIYPKVPKTTKYLTLVMDDKSGNRVANIVSEFAVSDKNIIAEDEDTYTIDVTWDGKGLYGDYVKAGEYVISGITHEGIKVFLDYAVYNPGTPAWGTADGKGGWGADHTPPISVASNGEQTFIGHCTAESGRAIIAVGADGKKEWGIVRGGRFLAASDDYLYAIPDTDFYWDSSATGDTYLVRLNKEDGGVVPFVLNGENRITELTLSTMLDINQKVMPDVKGLAAYGDMICIATGSNNTLPSVSAGNLMNYTPAINILDAESAVLKKKIPIPELGQIAFSRDGKLYAVSGDSIVLVNVSSGKYQKLPINLDEGMELGALTVDKDGNVLVFDKGRDLQVKAYNPDTGRKVYTIGKQGGRALMGEYDPSGFSHMVKNISADDAGHVWVPENWEYPRRTSVWNTDGTLYHEYIGTSGYMSAGIETHQTNENYAYAGANEMIVDHETKTWKMNRVLWVPDISKNQAYSMPLNDYHVQHTTIEVNGVKREYIFSVASEADAVIYAENDKGYFQPVCAMGRVSAFNTAEPGSWNLHDTETRYIVSDKEDLKNKRLISAFDSVKDGTFYVWNDLNGDAAIQIEECELSTTFALDSSWGQRITSDFRFVLTGTGADAKSGGVWMVTPDEITEDGIPRYSLKSFKKLNIGFDGTGKQEAILLEGTNKVLMFGNQDGNVIEKKQGVWVADTDRAGIQEWWYLNQYAGVHGSKSSPIGKKNGQIIGPIKCLGVIKVGDEEVFALRGNKGQDFFMTTDGYYIETVFNDGRRTGTNQNLPSTDMSPLEFSKIDFSEGSETGEPWGGHLAMHDDGVVRLGIASGGPTGIITRLEGLETIKRIDKFNFKVTLDMIAEARVYNYEASLMNSTLTIGGGETVSSITVNKVDASQITVDGNSEEWSELAGVNISEAGVNESAQAKLAHDGENLYAMFYVNDRSPMKNTGEDYTRLFKTGDAVDIQLSPSKNKTNTAAINDMRILISEYHGSPTAVLMQQKSTSTANKTLYGSPVMKLYFDNVEIIKDADVKISKTEEGAYYVVEAKIPFKSINLDVTSGETITGDIGFISSDEGGTYNTARVYFFNKETGIVNDIPSEAVLEVQNWGAVEFK